MLSEVVESEKSNYLPGQKIRSWGQWADYSIIDPDTMFPSLVDDSEIDLVNYVGILGANGWTAYVGVTETGGQKKVTLLLFQLLQAVQVY